MTPAPNRLPGDPPNLGDEAWSKGRMRYPQKMLGNSDINELLTNLNPVSFRNRPQVLQKNADFEHEWRKPESEDNLIDFPHERNTPLIEDFFSD